jgi:hypothetical protein
MHFKHFCPVLAFIVVTSVPNLSGEPGAQAASTTGDLRQLAELTASDSGGVRDEFGFAIAMSGNTVVVGAPFAHGNAGAAYVFVKPASGWTNMTETAELSASDSAPNINFGISVGISGNNIVVGSTAHNAAYVFTQPAGGWKNMTQTAVLSSTNNGSGSLFGGNVAIDGTTIAVGARDASFNRGRVDVFTEPPGGWVNATTTAHLTATDTTTNSFFGAGLSVSGSTIVVGAFGNNNDTGAAYVFVKPASGWNGTHNQTAKLTASDGVALDFFGDDVAIKGNTIAIGASGHNNNTGAAYVFVEPASGWENMTQNAELTASNGVAGNFVGSGLGVTPTEIAVGAPSNPGPGVVYTYVKPSTGWKNATETSEVTATGSQELGSSVAIVGTTVVAGARASSTAYVFGP